MPGKAGPGARALAGIDLTQEDVAELAGLSQWTVSSVLRGASSFESRHRVLAAVTLLRGHAAARKVEDAIPEPPDAETG